MALIDTATTLYGNNFRIYWSEEGCVFEIEGGNTPSTHGRIILTPDSRVSANGLARVLRLASKAMDEVARSFE